MTLPPMDDDTLAAMLVKAGELIHRTTRHGGPTQMLAPVAIASFTSATDAQRWQAMKRAARGKPKVRTMIAWQAVQRLKNDFGFDIFSAKSSRD